MARVIADKVHFRRLDRRIELGINPIIGFFSTLPPVMICALRYASKLARDGGEVSRPDISGDFCNFFLG